MDWAELRQVALLGTEGEGIPSLAEVLDILGPSGIKLRVELKTRQDGSRYRAIEAGIMLALRDRGLLDRTTFTSFDLATLADLAAIAPGRPLIWLIADRFPAAPLRDVRALCKQARAAGVQEIAIRFSQVQEAGAATCQEEAVRLGYYAVHDKPAIRQGFAAGAVAFTTARPDLAIALRP